MQGLHLTADLRGCLPALSSALSPALSPALTSSLSSSLSPMHEPEALRALCLAAVAGAGLQAVGELFHRFPAPGGVTGVVLLAESHLAVHTWPELDGVTLDVYVCNLNGDNSARAEAMLAALEAAFSPSSAERHRLQRGGPAPGQPVMTPARAARGAGARRGSAR